MCCRCRPLKCAKILTVALVDKLAQRLDIWPVVCNVLAELETSWVGEIERDMNAHTGTHGRTHIKSDEINTDEGRLGKYAEPN